MVSVSRQSDIIPRLDQLNQIQIKTLYLALTQCLRYKNEQLDLAEQKGGSSNIVDLTRRGTWSAKTILKSEHLARKTNKSSQSFWNIFNFYKMLSNIIHILDIAPLSGLLI